MNFEAGEIRTCVGCHSSNDVDQLGRDEAANPPWALRTLLTAWNANHPEANAKASPLQLWIEEIIGEASTPGGDADADKLSNFEEFVYGTDPNQPTTPADLAQPLRVRQRPDGQTALRFTRSLTATGVTIAIQSSPDLHQWQTEATISGEDIDITGSLSVTPSAGASLRHETAPRIPNADPRDHRRAWSRLLLR